MTISIADWRYQSRIKLAEVSETAEIEINAVLSKVLSRNLPWCLANSNIVLDPNIIEELNLSVVDDSSTLLSWIHEAIENNPQSVVDYKNGKSRAVGFLVGQVMKLSKGKADPALTNKMVVKELDGR